MTKEELQAFIGLHASQISEHVDSVGIYVTVGSLDGQSETIACQRVVGNFYAHQGQIEEWLEIQKQYQRNWAIRKDAKLHGSDPP